MTLEARAVLGIDAAWTAARPSGVALAVETPDRWRLAAVESSYERFVALPREPHPPDRRPRGSVAGVVALLDAASVLGGGSRVELVAVDMPLGPEPIVGRRLCDDRISSLYGARKAAVHSPSALRPGRISDDFRAAFDALGFSVCIAPPARGLIEVYPHAALIEFLAAPERLPYKASKSLTYWPELDRTERQDKLRETWRGIVTALDHRLEGAADALPIPSPEIVGWRLKAFEDKLDAVICAAVAVEALEGLVAAHGDAAGAIWVPTPAG